MKNTSSYTATSRSEKRNESNGPAASVNSRPEWIRLPRSGSRDPIAQLSRSTLNELTLPGPANGGRPPVKSIIIKKRHATRGIRLIHVGSLLGHLDALAADANAAPAPAERDHGSCAVEPMDL